MRKDCKDMSSFSILQTFLQELCIFRKNRRFQPFDRIRFRNRLSHTFYRLRYSDQPRQAVFLNRGCKGSDKFRTCKYFFNFFQKICIFSEFIPEKALKTGDDGTTRRQSAHPKTKTYDVRTIFVQNIDRYLYYIEESESQGPCSGFFTIFAQSKNAEK